jgi:hypothetical protein
MEYCDDDRHYIRPVKKTDSFVTRLEESAPQTQMEFKFHTTFNRAALQGRAEEMRKAAEAVRLLQIRQRVEQHVNQTEREILDAAAKGESFYLHEVRLPHDCTNDDIVRGFQEKFPDCTVTLAEEWVDVPVRVRGAVPTRVLKSGIKIDWS